LIADLDQALSARTGKGAIGPVASCLMKTPVYIFGVRPEFFRCF